MKTVWVTFQREGIHSYPDAPGAVAFLRNEHRHIFHFRAELEVFHNERDVEFIMFKRELEEVYRFISGPTGILRMDHMSCEALAENLESHILTKYPKRRYSVSVSEDGENGSTSYSKDFFK